MGNNRQGPAKSGSSELRKLPQVERLASSLDERWPAPLRVSAARVAVLEAKASVESGDPAPPLEEIRSRAIQVLQGQQKHRLTEVVNATGVILHTNLGRAPLSARAAHAVEKSTIAYSNLEYDLKSASRGSRYDHAADLLKQLTGAEDALVVNNNAAAVLLTLRGLARGKEVIVSRGELIEIGGEFRLPDVMAESGAIMREVGTTNRTHLKDYAAAIGPDTAAILKVHPSNYQIVGFTKGVGTRQLAALAAEHQIHFFHDIGSGLLSSRAAGAPGFLDSEPAVDASISEGATLVTFSGDKLLGGPQAGIICGKASAIAALKKTPMLRALRIDKMAIAALEETLLTYLRSEELELPVWDLATADVSGISERAQRIASGIDRAAAKIELIDGESTLGGGSAPGSAIPTVLLGIAPLDGSYAQLFRSLVDNDPPIVARVEDDRVLIDLRTVFPAQDDLVIAALERLL